MKGVSSMKRYYLSHNSYDYLARCKVLVTNDAKYGYIREIRERGQYPVIQASRRAFGKEKAELVLVGVRR